MKKGIGILIGIGKPKPGEPGDKDENEDEDASAGKAVLEAIEDKDPKALQEAIKLCCRDMMEA